MLSRKVLLICAASIFAFALRQGSSHAADQQEWFGDHISLRNMFIILHDSEIEKEVSMTPEQRTTLTELERQHRPRFSQTARLQKDLASKSPEEQETLAEKRKAEVAALDDEFRPQIWATFTPSQRERLYQIIWQLNVARALSEESQVTSRIHLDAEQKAAMGKIMNQFEKELKDNRQVLPPREVRRDRDEAAETKRDEQVLKILTDHQRAEWSTLIGKPLDVVALRPRVNRLRSQMDRAKMRSREKAADKS